MGLGNLGLGGLAYSKIKNALGRAWCLMLLIPAKLCEFRTSLIYYIKFQNSQERKTLSQNKSKIKQTKKNVLAELEKQLSR